MARSTTSLGFPVGRITPCQWGRGVKSPTDLTPCMGLAERRVTVKRAQDGKQRDFELCAGHLRKVLEQAEIDGHEVL